MKTRFTELLGIEAPVVLPGMSWLVFLLAFGALFANVLVFTWMHANRLLELDGWRYTLLYLGPILVEDSWDWKLFWSDYRPQPLNALLFVTNALFFDLRMDYEAIGAVFFLLPFAILLYRMYWRSLENVNASDDVKRFAFLLVASVVFSLSVPRPYVWSLASLQFIPNFAILVLFLLYERCTREGRAPWLLFVLTTIFLILSPDRVMLAVATMLGVGLLSLSLGASRRAVALTLLALIAAAAIQIAFFDAFDLGRGNYGARASRLVTKAGGSPLEYLQFFEIGLGSGFFNLYVLSEWIGRPDRPAWIAHVATLLYLGAAWLFFERRMWKVSFAPLLLMVYPLAVLAAAGAFRFNPDFHHPMRAFEARYVMMYAFGAIGATWVYVHSLLHRDPVSGLSPKVERPLIGAAVALILASQILHSQATWLRSIDLQFSSRQSEWLLLEYARGRLLYVPRGVAGGNFPEPFHSSMRLLRRNKLSLFARGFRPLPLEDHLHSNE